MLELLLDEAEGVTGGCFVADPGYLARSALSFGEVRNRSRISPPKSNSCTKQAPPGLATKPT